MRILAIAGPSNDSGKTALACQIVASRTATWQALKVSTLYGDGNCPRSIETARCACNELHDSAYKVIDDPGVLFEEDTDTGDLHAAGADPLLWGIARPGQHAALWEHLRPLLAPDRPLVTEGGQIAKLLTPTRLVAVVNPCTRARWKADAEALMDEADLVVVNPYERGRFHDDDPRALALVARLGPRAVLHDVSLPSERWPAALRALAEAVIRHDTEMA